MSFRTSMLTATLLAALAMPAAGQTYSEAPMLADMVANGELPPVDERLPVTPRVIPVFGEIGTYGGTMRRAFKGPSDRWGPTKMMEERVVEFEMSLDGEVSLVAGFVDEFSVSDDSSTYTFTLRDGLRWSDGAPVTTRDVRFWYEDVFLNEELTPSIGELYKSGGEPMTVEIVDDRTFVVSFAEPYPLFLNVLAKESTGRPGLDRPGFVEPFHYLKDFHATYADADALQAAVVANNVEKWTDLWDSRGPIQAWWFNPDMPVLTAWRIATPPPAEIVVMERNPFYYGVDQDGNQLPYIDKIEHRLFENQEAFNLMIIQGEIDMQARHVNPGDFTLFKENEAGGEYTVSPWVDAKTWTLIPNLNVEDEVLRGLFEDARFREALNVAIDREAINELVFSGLGEPRQAGPVSGSPNFDPELEQLWTEYDPDRADALLDEVGLAERDDAGFRLRPDGERLAIVIDTRFEAQNPTLELVRQFWEDVGVEALVRLIDRTLYTERVSTAAFEIRFGAWDRSSIISADPRLMLGWQTFAPEYFRWWDSGGTDGVEPPADHPVRQVWASWEAATSANTYEEAEAHVQDIVSVHRENGWLIGLVGETPAIFIVSNRLGNFPPGLVNDDVLRGQGIGHPQQMFIRAAAQ